MTSTIQHYRSTTAGSVPPALTAGRIGINHTDGNLFYRNAAGAVTARSLRDYGTVLAKGDVASVANLTLSIDPAVIGIMRGFLLRVKAVPSATSFLELRFGDASTIYASSGNYAWSNFFENVNFYDYDAISSGTASNSLGLSDGGSGSAAGTTIDSEVLISTNDPTPTLYRRASWKSIYHNNNICPLSGSGYRTADMDLTRIQLLFSTGTITKMKYSLTGLL